MGRSGACMMRNNRVLRRFGLAVQASGVDRQDGVLRP
jgi:hypothetical protein